MKTRSTLPVAISVPLTAVFLAVIAFQVLGPAQATETPGVSPVATETGPGVADAPGGRYLGKQRDLLNRLGGAPPPDGGAANGPEAVAVTNGVPRDPHGGAYLGKQPEILRHL
jgi:hypothetical protein